MKRKYLASLLIATAMVTSVVPVFADNDKSITGVGSTQAVVKSSFVVEDDTNIIISLPTNLDLTYDEGTQKYSRSASLSAQGDMSDSKLLTITIEDITYELQGFSTIHAKASHHFGDNSSDKSTVYTAEQLEAGKTVTDERGFSIEVNKTDIVKEGNYETNVIFDINVSNK